MLGIFKKLFTRESGESEIPPASTPTAPTPPPRAPSAASATPPPPSQTLAADSLALPLKGVLSRLPAELKSSLKQQPRGDASVRIALKTILDQLPRGVVKITFGELRGAAPPGLFADTGAHDQTAVELPLPDILARLKPSQLPRRPGQKRVEVPDEVRPIFGPDGKPSPLPPDSTPAPAKSAEAPVVAEPPKPAAAPKPAPPATPAAVVASTPAPAIPFKPVIPEPVKPAPIKPIAPLPEPPKKPAPTPPAAPIPITPAKLPVTPPQATPAPVVATKPAPTLPKPSPAPVETGVLEVPLETVSAGWPGPVRQEMAQRNLTGAKLELPLAEVGASIKSGKLVFTWLQIRNWLRPAMPLSATSANDGVRLELPLPVIFPLFMAKRKPAAPQRKTVIGENIPDLFKGTEVAAVKEAAPAAVAVAARPTVTPSPVSATPGTPAKESLVAPTLPAPTLPATPAPKPSPVPAPASIGDVLGEPGKTQWSPIEIVQRAGALPGVKGALIAMQDGLLVADQMPPEMAAETFAAFVPQLFGRMAHYTRELKMGEPTTVAVVVEGTSVQIFRAGSVYFAVLAEAGHAPSAQQLGAIAAYLGRQTQ